MKLRWTAVVAAVIAFFAVTSWGSWRVFSATAWQGSRDATSSPARLDRLSLTELHGRRGCIVAPAEARHSSCSVVQGVSGDLDIALSSDGRFAYLATGPGILTFARKADGSLSQLSGNAGCAVARRSRRCAFARGFPRISGETAVALSPDGRTVYLAAGNEARQGVPVAVLTFARDRASGRLNQLPGRRGCFNDTGALGCQAGAPMTGDVYDLLVSPDGDTVYVSVGDALYAFRRRLIDGKLAPLQCITSESAAGCDSAAQFLSPVGAAISRDGHFVYVASQGPCYGDSCKSGTLLVFGRDPETGRLAALPAATGCVRQHGRGGCADGGRIQEPIDIVLSPDGRFAYASDGARIASFRRDTASGALALLPGRSGCLGGGPSCTHLRGQRVPTGLAISPDGRALFAGSGFHDGVVTTFERDHHSGRLTQLSGSVGCFSATRRAGCARSRISTYPSPVLASGDGRNVYVAGVDQVTIFRRTPRDTE
jgi:hypothetical protein